MDIALLVNIILCVLSFILAVISVVTVLITLRQNSKMIESSTRPYISIYLGTTYFQQTTSYIIIKNYGASSATITNFNCDFDLSQCAYDKHIVPFSHISGTTISPEESLAYPVVLTGIPDIKNLEPISFSIEYKSSCKKYKEDISLNLLAHCDMVHLRASTKNKDLKIISFALQDIAEKML